VKRSEGCTKSEGCEEGASCSEGEVEGKKRGDKRKSKKGGKGDEGVEMVAKSFTFMFGVVSNFMGQ
jgi:hypothetical protein